MRRDADVIQPGEDVFADPVVDYALAVDCSALLRVERGGIVLEVLDQGARLGTFVEDLGLAFVDLAATRHRDSSRLAGCKNAKPRR
jgi:hypothetical protein